MTTTKTTIRYLITGANSYLGTCLARHLSKIAGNKVFTTSRNPGEFDQLTKPNHQHLSGIDLLKTEEISRLASAVSLWADGPFHIVNCVGYFPGYKIISETSVEEARKVFENNFLSLYATANKLLPIMQSKGGGHFIAFSSHTVSQSYPLTAAFSAAKASVESLIQSIANEYSKHGIVANALAIATLNSPRERDLRPEADNSDWLQVEQIIRFVEQFVHAPFNIMNGNAVHLFNYSESYFHQSYFARLGTRHNVNDQPANQKLETDDGSDGKTKRTN